MYLEVKSENYNIYFEFDRRITVIKGDSGTGKTTLVEMLQDSSYDVEKSSSLPVVICTETTWENTLKNEKSKIVILDDLICVETVHFAALCKEYVVANDLYLIVIGRESLGGENIRMSNLSYSVKSIYTMESSGSQYKLVPFYDLPIFAGKSDSVLVEDSKAGYEFF